MKIDEIFSIIKDIGYKEENRFVPWFSLYPSFIVISFRQLVEAAAEEQETDEHRAALAQSSRRRLNLLSAPHQHDAPSHGGDQQFGEQCQLSKTHESTNKQFCEWLDWAL